MTKVKYISPSPKLLFVVAVVVLCLVVFQFVSLVPHSFVLFLASLLFYYCFFSFSLIVNNNCISPWLVTARS